MLNIKPMVSKLYWFTLLIGLLFWASNYYLYFNVEQLTASWKTGLTMLLGSFVAGSTPLGGGAVAFPILTKVLAVPAEDAKVFSLFIQSIGMSFATLFFISKKIEIDWKTLSYALTFSVFGQFACLFINIESGLIIKHMYTCFLLLVAIILLDSFTHPAKTYALIFARKKLATAAFIGGLVSGFLGAGADTLLFFYYVILMKQSAKKVIPTTVALMAANAIIGSILMLSSNYVPSSFVITSWFFAAPIVALGAPLGGLIMTKLPPKSILAMVIFIIALEAVTTLTLLPLNWLEASVIYLLFSLLLVKIKVEIFFTRYKPRVQNIITSTGLISRRLPPKP
ncbi:sulfite exporter TauE/SafE family protein [Pseudoalteromonas aurantia]|nr:sulfite exporter TauE/SafE family protein [Pseudoalteromonas aurantia]TMO64062.1 sulfite exporter TauE/SafE family protein [Pseudoalteromonas aurantia]TMO67465.1 sulfite exporter TauE/SafE family protein [Pseudoalteromonas aurantia]TMO69050.1 sulfite exporter TauE/SafE family protein [Pseudoalteromonas aurantia]